MRMTGEKAVPFILKGVDEKSYRLEEFAGAWLLLVFNRHLG